MKFVRSSSQRTIKYQKAFNRLRREDTSYCSYFTSAQREEKNVHLDGPPSKDDWSKVETFVKLLGSDDLVLSNMADNMRAKFDKYWVKASVKNNMVLLEIVFDPRYKIKYLNFCFKKLYGENVVGIISEEGKEMVDRIELELQALYKEYMDRYAFKERIESSNSNVIDEERDANWEEMDCEFRMELHVETKIASEQEFSTGSRMLNEFRSSLKWKTVEILVCAQNWLKTRDDPIDMKIIMEDVEKYEEISYEVHSTLEAS
ncbi:hypothetical protein LIER_18981 [Lithospermum erythrorhizon]|uniref:Uncharacterized protein n=1 Tax=Lithospermum erythrorhizon TaxID=34254 RepID=A0AAV3QG50_LITER